MTNHPKRSRGPYRVELFSRGSSFAPLTCNSIREARALAESEGDRADICTVYAADGEPAAQFRRDKAGDGMRWYRATI